MKYDKLDIDTSMNKIKHEYNNYVNILNYAKSKHYVENYLSNYEKYSDKGLDKETIRSLNMIRLKVERETTFCESWMWDSKYYNPKEDNQLLDSMVKSFVAPKLEKLKNADLPVYKTRQNDKLKRENKQFHRSGLLGYPFDVNKFAVLKDEYCKDRKYIQVFKDPRFKFTEQEENEIKKRMSVADLPVSKNRNESSNTNYQPMKKYVEKKVEISNKLKFFKIVQNESKNDPNLFKNNETIYLAYEKEFEKYIDYLRKEKKMNIEQNGSFYNVIRSNSADSFKRSLLSRNAESFRKSYASKNMKSRMSIYSMNNIDEGDEQEDYYDLFTKQYDFEDLWVYNYLDSCIKNFMSNYSIFQRRRIENLKKFSKIRFSRKNDNLGVLNHKSFYLKPEQAFNYDWYNSIKSLSNHCIESGFKIDSNTNSYQMNNFTPTISTENKEMKSIKNKEKTNNDNYIKNKFYINLYINFNYKAMVNSKFVFKNYTEFTKLIRQKYNVITKYIKPFDHLKVNFNIKYNASNHYLNLYTEKSPIDALSYNVVYFNSRKTTYAKYYPTGEDYLKICEQKKEKPKSLNANMFRRNDSNIKKSDFDENQQYDYVFIDQLNSNALVKIFEGYEIKIYNNHNETIEFKILDFEK